MLKYLKNLFTEERIDVRILKRKADWVVYSACTPEQVESAKRYYSLYEGLLERWHTGAFLTSFALPLVGFALLLTIVLLCVSVRSLEEVFRQFNF